MEKKEQEWFEKGRAYEQLFAEKLAEEKAESMMICLLERAMGGAGEMVIPDLDLQIARQRYVVFSRPDKENMATKLKLVKEIL